MNLEEPSGPPPIESIPQWYFVKNQQQVGPIPLNQLGQLAATGQLGPNEMVWRKGMAEWTIARNVKEFGSFQWTSPPPIPRAAPLIMAEPIDETETYDVERVNVLEVQEASLLERHDDGARQQSQPVENIEPSRPSPFDRLRKTFPALSGWSDKRFKIAGGVVLVSILACLGAITSIMEDRTVRKDLHEAHELWAKDRKSEAVAKYKQVLEKYKYKSSVKSERPTILQRVIDFEADQGDTSAARNLIEKADKEQISVQLTSPKAKELVAQVQRERQEQEAAAIVQKKKQDEVANAKNRFGPPRLSNDPEIAAARIACHAFLSAVESNNGAQAYSLCQKDRQGQIFTDASDPSDRDAHGIAHVSSLRGFWFAYAGYHLSHTIDKETLFIKGSRVIFEGTYCHVNDSTGAQSQRYKFILEVRIVSFGPDAGQWLIDNYQRRD